MARGNLSISQPRIMTAMAGVALGVTVVAALYFAHAIFIPLALAVFLTFILAPVVNLLQRWLAAGPNAGRRRDRPVGRAPCFSALVGW